MSKYVRSGIHCLLDKHGAATRKMTIVCGEKISFPKIEAIPISSDRKGSSYFTFDPPPHLPNPDHESNQEKVTGTEAEMVAFANTVVSVDGRPWGCSVVKAIADSSCYSQPTVWPVKPLRFSAGCAIWSHYGAILSLVCQSFGGITGVLFSPILGRMAAWAAWVSPCRHDQKYPKPPCRVDQNPLAQNPPNEVSMEYK